MMAPPKTLGVLGGLGPAAGAQFLRCLAEAAPAEHDQQHPRVIMLSDPSVPDRSRALLAGDDRPEQPLLNGLLTLVDWGADLLAVPCNTAHAFIDRFADRLTVPLVHIVDATIELAARAGHEAQWLVATMGTTRSELYQQRAQRAGLRLEVPDEIAQRTIDECVAAVKRGDGQRAAVLITDIVEHLGAIEDLPILAACTEIPIAYEVAGLPATGMLSSLEALATACVTQLYASS